MFRSAKRQEPAEDAGVPAPNAAAVAVRPDNADHVAGTRDPAHAVSSSLEAETPMDGSGDTGSYPFAPADLDIDMMDKVRTVANGSTAGGTSMPGNPAVPVASPPVSAAGTDPVHLAQQVASVVQGLAERVRELDIQRQVLAQKVAAGEDAARAGESLRQTLRDTVLSTSVTAEDLQTMQRVLAALSKDPNHIMVLASVAQQAGKLTAVVESFARLHRALQQAPPK